MFKYLSQKDPSHTQYFSRKYVIFLFRNWYWILLARTPRKLRNSNQLQQQKAMCTVIQNGKLTSTVEVLFWWLTPCWAIIKNRALHNHCKFWVDGWNPKGNTIISRCACPWFWCSSYATTTTIMTAEATVAESGDMWVERWLLLQKPPPPLQGL